MASRSHLIASLPESTPVWIDGFGKSTLGEIRRSETTNRSTSGNNNYDIIVAFSRSGAALGGMLSSVLGMRLSDGIHEDRA